MNLASVSHLSQTLFEWDWRTSLHATVLIAFVVLIQRLFGRLLSARCRFGLWLLVLLRLVLPVAPASAFSIFNLGDPAGARFARRPSAATETVARSFQPIPQNSGGRMNETLSHMRQSFVQRGVPVHEPGQAEQASAGDYRARFEERAARPIDLRTVAAILWLSGCAVSLLIAGWRQRRFSRGIGVQSAVRDDRVNSLLEECKKAIGVSRAVEIWTTPALGTPALCGFRRPRLLVPDGLLQELDERELRMIFLHELAHVRRADILLNWLVLFVRSLHWFNPLVWLAMRRLRADRELVCDAMVLAHLAAEERRIYGNTLIRLLNDFPAAGFFPSLAPVINHKNEIKRRIIMIAEFKPEGRVARALSAMLIVAVCGFTFTRAAEKQRKAASESSAEGQLDAKRKDGGPDTMVEALKKQLEEANANVRDAQERVDSLRRELGISDLLVDGKSAQEAGGLSGLNPRSVREFESERVRVESELRGLDSLLRALKSRRETELENIMSVAVPDELLTLLLKTKAESEQRLAGLTSRLGPENAEVQAATHQYEKVRDQIKCRIEGILTGLQVKMEATSTHRESLSKAIDEARSKELETAARLRPYWEARRRLEDSQRVQDAIQMRILQETIDSALPKSKSQEK